MTQSDTRAWPIVPHYGDADASMMAAMSRSPRRDRADGMERRATSLKC